MTVYYSSVHCSAVYCSAVYCSLVYCSCYPPARTCSQWSYWPWPCSVMSWRLRLDGGYFFSFYFSWFSPYPCPRSYAPGPAWSPWLPPAWDRSVTPSPTSRRPPGPLWSEIVYSVQCKVYCVQCTVHSAKCTVYTVHWTMYCVKCTLCIVHYRPSRTEQLTVQLCNIRCLLYTCLN